MTMNSLDALSAIKDLRKKASSSKAVNTDGLSGDKKAALRQSEAKNTKGVGLTKLFEPLPDFIKGDAEKVYNGDNNTYIVLGRDRPGSVFSGYGGKGDTGAGSIDIVAGRLSAIPLSNPDDQPANPDFKHDAARIFISQKTDIDKNFDIEDIEDIYGQAIPDLEGLSGIGIKADGVRIIARHDIKLMTATDGRNSQKGPVKSIGGIYLIAGSPEEEGDEIQPIALGHNVAEALNTVHDMINDLKSTVWGFMQEQIKFNEVLASHGHHSPFWGQKTTPSPPATFKGKKVITYQSGMTIPSLFKLNNNLESFKSDYTEKSGILYVGSKHNKTN